MRSEKPFSPSSQGQELQLVMSPEMQELEGNAEAWYSPPDPGLLGTHRDHVQTLGASTCKCDLYLEVKTLPEITKLVRLLERGVANPV